MVETKTQSTISAFERRRLENIAQNNAILGQISAKAAKILPPPKPPVSSAQAASSRARRSRRGGETPVKREPARPTRQSSRLAGLDAHAKAAGEDEADWLKRKALAEAETEEQRRQKKMRVSGDLPLGDIQVEGRKWEGGLDGLAGLKGLLSRGAQPGVRTFTDEDVRETTDADLKDLRLRLSGLQLYDKWAVNDIKIVPQRVYAMGFHPTEEKPIVFAGDKEGAMGVFDASQPVPKVEDDDDDDDGDTSYPDPVISAFKTHARTISSFHFSPADANAVFSASYDSSIRKLDLDKGVSVEVFAPDDADDDMPISALDMADADPHVVLFSTLQGSLGRHDLRTRPGEADVWHLLDFKIGGFSLHPLHPHLVATASLDRTLKIWDLRTLGKSEDDGALRPALLGTHESRLSVSHASWSRGGRVATSSYDNTVKIYDFSGSGAWAAGRAPLTEEEMRPARAVPHNNQTGRWVTILKPQWQARPRDGLDKLAIGNMNRFVDVFGADGEQLAQLGGEGITAVPAVAHFHPTLDWVAGGTATGKLCLWM